MTRKYDEFTGPTTEAGVLQELLDEVRRRALGIPHKAPSPDDDIAELGMVAGIPRMGPWSYSNEQLASAIKYQLDRMNAQPGLGGLNA